MTGTAERGRFISVEGIEGVGKSSNIEVLVTHIENAGYEVLTTREPGGTPLAEDIRQLLMHRGDEPISGVAELLLMFAARSLNVNNNIRPALEAGKWVVCDRFTDSSRAYQSGGRGPADGHGESIGQLGSRRPLARPYHSARRTRGGRHGPSRQSQRARSH